MHGLKNTHKCSQHKLNKRKQRVVQQNKTHNRVSGNDINDMENQNSLSALLLKKLLIKI